MSTSDGFAPPRELQGPLGQVVGATIPTAVPAPNAASGFSPGIGQGALPTPPINVGPLDPASMTVVISQLANGLFGAGPIGPPGPYTGYAPPSGDLDTPHVPSETYGGGVPTVAATNVPAGAAVAPYSAQPSPQHASPVGANLPLESTPSSPTPVAGLSPSPTESPFSIEPNFSAPTFGSWNVGVPGDLPLSFAGVSAPGAIPMIPPTGIVPSTSVPSPGSPDVPSYDSNMPGLFEEVFRLPFVDESFEPVQQPALPTARDAKAPAPNATSYDTSLAQSTRSSDGAGSALSTRPDAVPALPRTAGMFDPHAVRRDFPILQERVNGKPLVWLDNAATTQKPRAVIERIKYFYEHENSNVHRAAHTLAARSTDAFENARGIVRRFLNASSTSEIIWVRGATEGINLIAQSWGKANVREGDEVLITWLEHHANIVPWHRLCAQTGAKLRIAPVDDRGDIILEEYARLLSNRTRLVAFPQVSNALGTVTPAQEMVEMAHRYGARVLVDGAQAVSHMAVDVQKLDCDFYVFSGHKVFAPTGIGAVFAKSEVLADMPPWQSGGNMIEDVTFETIRYNPPPSRFEAGTGSIADAVGLGAALDYLTNIGLESVKRYEHELIEYAINCLRPIPGLRFIGSPKEQAGVVSFVLAGQRTEDVGRKLDAEGIAVRSGHHCAQPILRRFGVENSVRASFAPYNLFDDVDALVRAVAKLQGASFPS